MDRRQFLMGTSAASLVLATQPVQAKSTFTGLLDRTLQRRLDLSPQAASAAGLDEGRDQGRKRRLDDRSSKIGFYNCYVEAAADPAMKSAHTGSDRLAAATLRWFAETINPFQAMPYGGIGGYDYPIPYVVSQVSGAYRDIPDFLATKHTIATKADAEAYLARLSAFSRTLDVETQRMRDDVGHGCTPPHIILVRTAAQLAAFQAGQNGDQAGLVRSLANRTSWIPGDFAARAVKLVDGPIAAAIARQATLINQLQAGARQSAGIGDLPGGEAYYAQCLRFHTSTDLTPDAAHALGLEQVAKISDDIRARLAANKSPGQSVAEALTSLGRDPSQAFANDDAGRAALLVFIRNRLDKIRQILPAAFARLPKTPLDVNRVPIAIELGSPGAYAESGSLDGTRPGNIYFNLHDTANWPRFELPTTVFHEGLPGHHLQGSLAKESLTLHPLMKLLWTNAYGEGWALYAEQLAEELGVYDDMPLGPLGRLKHSLFRACRIVVDTGLHSRGWTREAAIAYLVDTCALSQDDARREIERYCSWPGQACGYKIGHLEFLRLRDVAKDRLGAGFDLKAFHEVVLGCGSVPLKVLAEAVDQWLATQKG